MSAVGEKRGRRRGADEARVLPDGTREPQEDKDEEELKRLCTRFGLSTRRRRIGAVVVFALGLFVIGTAAGQVSRVESPEDAAGARELDTESFSLGAPVGAREPLATVAGAGGSGSGSSGSGVAGSSSDARATQAIAPPPAAVLRGAAMTSTTMQPEALVQLRARSRQNGPPKEPRLVGPALAGQVKPLAEPGNATSLHLIISSFRDGARCARTLGFALEKAAFPNRLHFQVLQAVDGNQDDSCARIFASKQLKEFCDTHVSPTCEADVLGRSRFWTIPLEHGMGPAHQRGTLNELLEFDAPDAFCMTTDSHMDFIHNWDVATINDWRSTDNEFAVLSVYPKAMGPNVDSMVKDWRVDLCNYNDEGGIPRGAQGGDLPRNAGSLPWLTINWAAGLSFHRCHMDRNVPVDKHLRWIFTGEEINRALRLFTHGYDIYSPSVTTVVHDYGHAKQDFWQFSDRALQDHDRAMSRDRLFALLGASPPGYEVDLGAFGVGSQRTVEQFVEWSHQPLATGRWEAHLRAKGLNKPLPGDHTFCKSLSRVPVADVDSLRAVANQGFRANEALGPLQPGDSADDPTTPQRVSLSLA